MEPWKQALAEALRRTTYEVLPMRRTEDEVLAHVPEDVGLTVTTTQARGLEATVELAVRLAKNGYRAVPHLAARLVRDRAELADIAARLDESGVDGAFVIGGDAAEPAGEFPDALSLLLALQEEGRPFRIGIAGYPEGHGVLADEVIRRALRDKTPHADEVLTQLCFDPATTVRWARGVRAEGVRTPIRVGLPGPVDRQKLVRISAGLGLGRSARFLRKQPGLLRRFFRPGGFDPDRLARGLAQELAGADPAIAGFHVFTFNDLASTERWRRRWLDRVG